MVLNLIIYKENLSSVSSINEPPLNLNSNNTQDDLEKQVRQDSIQISVNHNDGQTKELSLDKVSNGETANPGKERQHLCAEKVENSISNMQINENSTVEIQERPIRSQETGSNASQPVRDQIKQEKKDSSFASKLRKFLSGPQ